MRILFTFSIVILATVVHAAPDPGLYEYYTDGGVNSGLQANSDQFTLNGKHFVIYSGSFHYFRVVPQHWPHILQRFKAAGLNAIQFYLPWNIHEDIPDHFDFESASLNLTNFLEEIKAADMFAIVRPGPYICAEWELGGYPSWLLRDPHMQLRTMYVGHLNRVKIFMEHVMNIINKYQFTTTGGPVIALQLENEYGYAMRQNYGAHYLNFLRDIVHKSGFKELLFASDPASTADHFPIKNVFADHTVLQTTNLNSDALRHLAALKQQQPHKPAYVSEFWSGWFDFWYGKVHHQEPVDRFNQEVSDILFKMNGSVNFYMFAGGTNFGFTNGARTVTSYDFDAPLSESGNYTPKYHKTRELYQKLVASGHFPKIHLPDVPPAPESHAYGKVQIQDMLPYETVLVHATKFTNMHKPIPMELLNLTAKHNHGQRFGYIVYRVEEKEITEYNVTGSIHDHAIFLVDQHEYGVLQDGATSYHYFFKHPLAHKATNYKYDLLVENMGRPPAGDPAMNHARKGILDGDIVLDDIIADNITIYSLDFSPNFVNKLTNLKATEWHKFNATETNVTNSPGFYRTHLKLDHAPVDTYLSLPGWNKGVVFVNGFNIGRYWAVGPQKTLYVPGPVLKVGQNTIELFELHKHGHELEFLNHPILA